MKKMVCEICGSSSIKKENGVFVCQECGTEYSLEEAKKLLVETSDSNNDSSSPVSSKNTSINGKDYLINALNLWVVCLSKMPDIYYWFNIPKENMNSDIFWTKELPSICNKSFPYSFPKIDNSRLFLSDKNGGGSAFWIESWEYDNPNSFYASLKREKPDYYNLSLKSLEMAKRFYGKKCVISEIIEEEAKNDLFQNKIHDFFDKYREANYDGSPLYCWFPSLIGRGREIPGKGYVNEITYPKITKLSAEYNTRVCDDGGKKLYTITKGFFREKNEYLPDSVTNTFKTILKAGSDIVLEFIDKHNKMMDYCEEKYPEICDLMKDFEDNCKKLESTLFVPYKYRSIPILLSLIDLVNDGKATNWQDLINLYDTHQFRIGVYEKLEAINTKLEIIQNTLVAGFTAIVGQLNEVNLSLKNIDSKISSINDELKSIKKYNFITMWNSL